ncbi:hypothetical protein SteCoe_28340 [Stentor coeruleus]|uniref:Major facilitator superfamily (MFS) profile domain-containing protein n=1 Tax=Stentor coeruleus TaxID=5963 RepID=A0A1R2B8E8_9CILI|nr:hypothetical protein SteCoe_28340 [Stentor coeruleus]
MLGNSISTTQAKVFFLTFMCMVAAHASREAWYMIKPDLQLYMGFDSTYLGAIDTTFLFLYSLGYYSSGILADKFKPTNILAIGMSIGMISFWIISILGIFQSTEKLFYLMLWAIEGPAQGCILTTSAAVMGNWFPSSIRGKIMGVWGSNASVGNIFGEWIAAFVLETMHLPWQAVMLIVATFLGCAGISTRLGIEDKPHHSNLDPLRPKPPSLSFIAAWREQGVLLCALCYGCVKLLNYGFLMWLPFYLQNSYGMSFTKIGFLATLYDIGAITGSVMAGFLSDKFRFRSAVVEIMLILSIPAVMMFRVVDSELLWFFYILSPCAGYMIGGSANIISTAISADLSIDNTTKESRATIIGIINGTGSLGAASGQIFIGWLQTFSWSYVFLFLVAVAAFAAVTMLPIVYQEWQKRKTE